jgi:hypothetical protein
LIFTSAKNLIANDTRAKLAPQIAVRLIDRIGARGECVYFHQIIKTLRCGQTAKWQGKVSQFRFIKLVFDPEPLNLPGGIALAESATQEKKKGGEIIMNNFKSKLSIVIAASVLATSAAALAADDVVVEGKLTPGSYCHEKFPAMRPRSLSDSQPELKSSSTGDMIDFYGPCSENPTGRDQVASQKLEEQHWLDGSLGGASGRF